MTHKTKNALTDAPVPRTRTVRTIDTYEAREAMHTLARAEEIRSDKRMMREVQKQVATISKAAGGAPKRGRGR